MNRATALAIAAATTCATGALAADAESCRTVRMSDPGWTDITATNSVASVILTALDYEADVKTLSVPIGYEAMKNADIDVFLVLAYPLLPLTFTRSAAAPGPSSTWSLPPPPRSPRTLSPPPPR